MKRPKYLPFFRPSIEEDDVSAVTQCLRDGWLTTGARVGELEREFAAKTGVRDAIALNSATSGLQLGLIALGVGPGDEVVTPALTFVAGANCIRQLGAVPVFCDVDPQTLCITPETILPTLSEKTKAIIPMQFGGRPVGIGQIVQLGRQRGIAVLEDAAHAVGTLDDGLWPGALSDCAVYSLYATKNITSGEGGIFVTNRDDLARRVRTLALHGMSRDAWARYERGGSWEYDVVAIGYKCNMADLLAALGVSQFRRIDELQRRREALARRYLHGLRGLRGVHPVSPFLTLPQRHSWCLFAVRVDPALAGVTRGEVIDGLRRQNIGTSVHFIPTHLFSAYRESARVALPNTERIWQELVSLPLYPDMALSDVDDVVSSLQRVLSLDSVKSRPEAVSAANVPQHQQGSNNPTPR
jgi:dTDP-4-amino-4,6-dideoxygalactose transaminase